MGLGVSGFLQKLVAMLDAGQPLVRSLCELGSSEELAPALRPIARQLADDVSAGSSFSDALAKYPTVFDPGYMAMLKLFEDEMLKAGGPVNEAPAP
jgi:type IV pilus assembly protein PilC